MFICTQHASGEVIFGLKKRSMVVHEFVMLSKSKISFKGSYFERLALTF
jgi:predicted acetyltransferase